MSSPEAYLISAVIQSGEFQHLVAQSVNSTMFYAHKDEMEWLENYITVHNAAPDEVALKHTFPNFRLANTADVKHWCDEVRQAYKRQALVDLLDAAMDDVDGDIDKAMSLIESGIATVRHSTAGLEPDFDLFDDWEQVYDEAVELADKYAQHGSAGIPTGFDTFDYITGGIQSGWYGVISARLGQGKTWTGIKLAWTAAMSPANYTVSYFSLEQSRNQIARRAHAFGSAMYAKQVFNPSSISKGMGVDLVAYRKFLARLQQKRAGQGRLYINDTSRGRVTASTIAHVIETRQPNIVFIDQLSLMGRDDDWQGMARLSGDLQSYAQRYNVAIVALSQVNRAGATGEPAGAENLALSDAIGQDADFIITQAQKSQRVMKMKLAKFRHGPAGDTWYAKFDPANGEYEEIDSQTAENLMEEDSEED